MDFHDFQSTYDTVRRQGLVTGDPEQFYREALAICIDMARRIDRHRFAVEYNKTTCEWDWHRLGRPYFKVFPAMIPLLSNVNVDVPIEYLRPPFPAFLIRLPTTDNPLVIEGEYHVRTILVAEGRPDGDEDDRRMYLWMDIGERDPAGVPILTYCQLPCEPGLSIDDAFSRLPMEPDIPGIVVPRELQARCLRLAVSVCFLATGQDRLIEPDVLSKDLAAYVEAHRRNDLPRIRTIEERATRRGKRGWNVGRQERFRPLVAHAPRDVPPGHDGHGPLAFQHQRRAHFRLLTTGKVTFVRQATVRPDLPPPPSEAGYRVQ